MTAANQLDPPAPPHGLLDDLQGFACAVLLTTFGLFLLHHAGAVTGGTAGLSLLVSYLAPVPFPVVFALINVPFLLLGARFRGWASTLRSLVAIAVVAGLSPLEPLVVPRIDIAPAYAVVIGNVCAGVGLIVLFRHRATLGGFNIVALIAQERFGLRAGYVQLGLDLVVVLLALVRVPLPVVALSAAGAAILDLILAVNHRPGRYRA